MEVKEAKRGGRRSSTGWGMEAPTAKIHVEAEDQKDNDKKNMPLPSTRRHHGLQADGSVNIKYDKI